MVRLRRSGVAWTAEMICEPTKIVRIEPEGYPAFLGLKCGIGGVYGGWHSPTIAAARTRRKAELLKVSGGSTADFPCRHIARLAFKLFLIRTQIQRSTHCEMKSRWNLEQPADS